MGRGEIKLQIFNTIKGIKNFSADCRCSNPDKKIAFVPTMGFLHKGHLSLIRKAKKIADCVVVSIFVNPVQFNNHEDYEKYPVNIEKDKEILIKENVDVLFNPSVEEVYRSQNKTHMIQLKYEDLMSRLCGKDRPGHFEGVLLIVHNLFQWIRPHFGVFGLKDYQQQLLIQYMVRDLAMDIKIITGDLIRESDGLAMSSRNVRLDNNQRKNALQISKALFMIRDLWEKKEKVTVKEMKKVYREVITDLVVDYADIYHPETLEKLQDDDIPEHALCAVAAYAGEVRLIDNLILS